MRARTFETMKINKERSKIRAEKNDDNKHLTLKFEAHCGTFRENQLMLINIIINAFHFRNQFQTLCQVFCIQLYIHEI